MRKAHVYQTYVSAIINAIYVHCTVSSVHYKYTCFKFEGPGVRSPRTEPGS